MDTLITYQSSLVIYLVLGVVSIISFTVYIITTSKCHICREQMDIFHRHPRKDAFGHTWCRKCVKEHDSIDWE